MRFSVCTICEVSASSRKNENDFFGRLLLLLDLRLLLKMRLWNKIFLLLILASLVI